MNYRTGLVHSLSLPVLNKYLAYVIDPAITLEPPVRAPSSMRAMRVGFSGKTSTVRVIGLFPSRVQWCRTEPLSHWLNFCRLGFLCTHSFLSDVISNLAQSTIAQFNLSKGTIELTGNGNLGNRNSLVYHKTFSFGSRNGCLGKVQPRSKLFWLANLIISGGTAGNRNQCHDIRKWPTATHPHG